MAALAVAAVVLVAAVLPAEYGIDPTGVGRLLGLTELHQPVRSITVKDVIGGNEHVREVAIPEPGQPTPLPNPAVHQDEPAAPKSATITLTLGIDQETEIKAIMREAKVMLYSWHAEGGTVYSDFHGHDPSLGERFWVRYEEADGITGRNGSLVAPFKGQHGWYWLNVSEKPVTITLNVTGYQDKLIDYGRLQ